MKNTWIALQSIPPGGSTLTFDEQELWRAPIREFGLDCRILDPVKAEIFVLPQGDGVLFRGRLTGRVALPCDRCSDESVVSLDHGFDSFEPYPVETLPIKSSDSTPRSGKGKNRRDEPEAQSETLFAGAEDVDEAVIRNAAHGGGIEINPAALAWEEFSLALPVKPLCDESCKGLCPVCGKNRNAEPCTCAEDKGDPRLAVLRGLTVNKK